MLLVGCGALVGAMPIAANAQDSFDPAAVVVTLGAGESTTIDKLLHLEALPGSADILIAIDTTGSMGTAIAQAKAQATALCTNVQAEIPGARFAVWDFRDLTERPAPANGIAKTLNTFTSSCAAVQAAINAMSAGAGFDFAEAYNHVFHQAYSDPVLDASRNPNAVQFLVVLGDAPPHNTPAPSVAPSCGNQPPADLGITSTSAIAGLNANDITLLMIHYSTPGNIPIACYHQLAGATGGTAVESGGDLSDEIIGQIRAAAAHIGQVQLVVNPGCLLGITFDPAPPYGPFTAPEDIPFEEVITAPTVPGGYSCTVSAVVDGATRAEQTVTVTVTAGDAASLTLTPPTLTNLVDTQHCVTATVEDAFGNPNGGLTVRFSVTPDVGRSPSSGTGVTAADGTATFCYTSALPGPDVINAYADVNNNAAQDAGEPFGAAAKVWVLPASTADCKVTYGGRIAAANGDKATFGGNAKVHNDGVPRGQQEYQDHGLVRRMNVHSINVLALVCSEDSPEASIHGTATIQGSPGSVIYRIDVKDVDEPGAGVDTYRIRLSNGYDSGEMILRGGNVQLHNR